MRRADPPLSFAGVDGGGSTCRVRIRDRAGSIVGQASHGPANVYLAFDQALATIRASLHEASDAAGLEPGRLRVGLGLAGISSEAVAGRVAAALSAFAEVAVSNDADIACIGAHAGADGGLVVTGTGSIGVARIGGRRIAVGGRGFIMGDDGSGARLGLAALRAALRARDGLGEASPLTATLMARFDDDPVRAVEWGRTASSSAFGTLAPIVLDAARAGDPVGTALAAEAAAAVAGLVRALRAAGAERVSLVGGLSAALLPLLPPEIAAGLAPPRYDALDGALLLAGLPAEALGEVSLHPR